MQKPFLHCRASIRNQKSQAETFLEQRRLDGEFRAVDQEYKRIDNEIANLEKQLGQAPISIALSQVSSNRSYSIRDSITGNHYFYAPPIIKCRGGGHCVMAICIDIRKHLVSVNYRTNAWVDWSDFSVAHWGVTRGRFLSMISAVTHPRWPPTWIWIPSITGLSPGSIDLIFLRLIGGD
jgi:hypothetical protein